MSGGNGAPKPTPMPQPAPAPEPELEPAAAAPTPEATPAAPAAPPDGVWLDSQLAQVILNYLVRHPYIEVHEMVAGLMNAGPTPPPPTPTDDGTDKS